VRGDSFCAKISNAFLFVHVALVEEAGKPLWKFESLRPFNILRAVSTVERLETERGIISNGVKEARRTCSLN
jgi:hypothetical protein